MRYRLTSLFVAAVLLNALARECLSDSFASVRTADGHLCGDSGNFFATASCRVDAHPSHFGVFGVGSAYAGFGHVGAFASATAPGVPLYHSYIQLRANGTSTYTDMILSTTDSTATSIATLAWFHVSGSITTGGPAGGVASVHAAIHVASESRTGSIIASSTEGPSENDYDGLFASGASQFEDEGGFNIPVGALIPVGEFTVSISVTVSAEAGQNGSPSGIASFANANFSHTVGFARDRPVFDLPEGWTVNSVSANIVNNYWVPPVPEPSSVLLGLFAVAGWSAFTIRRKRAS